MTERAPATCLHFLDESARLHFVTESATPLVEADVDPIDAWLAQWSSLATPRARAVEDRITRTAQQLTLEHGLDGFTMDELATATEVSRRTLFNHFPSKVDAVLGNPPPIPRDLLDAFVAEQPHGHLLRDFGALIAGLITSAPHTREDAARLPLLLRDPRLMEATHVRFADAAERFAELCALRGRPLAERQSRLLVILVLSLVKEALDAFVHDEERDLPTLFVELLEETLGLLG